MFWHVSVCLCTPKGVPRPALDGGWYPSQVPAGRGVGIPTRSRLGDGTLARSSQWGYPSQLQLGGTPPGWGVTPPWVLLSDLPRGYPTLTPPWVPPSHLDRGYPCQGVPHLGYPPSYLARGCPYWGGTPPWITDGELDTPPLVCFFRSCRRTFLCNITLED